MQSNKSFFQDLCQNYKVVLCDIFGVIHNGVQIYDKSLEMLETFQQNDVKVILFSNAPRRVELVEEQLEKTFNLKKGILYNDIITSGEVFFHRMKNSQDEWMNCIQKKLYFQIGKHIDKTILTDLGYETTDDLEKAEFILITNTWDEVLYSLDCQKKQQFLKMIAEQKKPIICNNPDIKIPIIQGEEAQRLCAGAVGKVVQMHNGEVIYYGKPYSQVYEYAFDYIDKKYNITDKNKILAIGDSMDTDIQGANNNQIDSILVTTGLYRDLSIEEIKQQLVDKKLHSNWMIEFN
jgi:HAD superfamily hydrolase (TIGR01459 family)